MTWPYWCDGAGTGPSAVPAPTVDPRLILHPHSVALAAHLRGPLHLQLAGTLTPDLPGTNILTLQLARMAGEHPGGTALLQLPGTVPGMRMLPLHATLVGRGGRYTGALLLPMFETYQVAVAAVTSTGPLSGVLTVTVALPAS